MDFDFPTRRTNPLIEHFLSHAIHHNAPNSMKLGNYDSDEDEDEYDEDNSYDPKEDLSGGKPWFGGNKK